MVFQESQSDGSPCRAFRAHRPHIPTARASGGSTDDGREGYFLCPRRAGRPTRRGLGSPAASSASVGLSTWRHTLPCASRPSWLVRDSRTPSRESTFLPRRPRAAGTNEKTLAGFPSHGVTLQRGSSVTPGKPAKVVFISRPRCRWVFSAPCEKGRENSTRSDRVMSSLDRRLFPNDRRNMAL